MSSFVCLLFFDFFVAVVSFLSISLFLFVWFCFYHLSSVQFVCLFTLLCILCVFLVLLFVSVCLLFVLGFVCLFSFPFFFYRFSLDMQHGLQALGSPARGRAWAYRVGVPCPGRWTAREFLGSGNINQHALSWRYTSRHKDLAPPNC